MLLKNILDIANKHFFFSPILTKNSKNVLFYQLGPSGSLFQDNIKSEWIYSNVTNRDASIFLFAKNTCDKRHDNQTYMNVRDICNGQLPFGVANISTRSSEAQNVHNITENSYFNSLVRTCLSTQMYMPPSEGMHFFFDWQRQRKLWWKKMSAFPGRYILGEVTKSADEKITSVNVLANFSWGNQILEKISVMSLDEDSDVDLTVRHQRKSVIPMVIRSELSLECAVVGLFSDALDSDSVHKKPVLRIHRKLAPYKCIFAASSSDPTTAMELEQLAFYLTKQFRKSGISTACLPDCAKDTLPHQFQRNDEWGIPYTIVLDDNSLKSGIVNLRNRDTTLMEEVHVSELSPYITHIFKNF